MKHTTVWDRWAGIYDLAMHRDAAMYAALLERIRPCARGRYVLEVATGTGKIARGLSRVACAVEATDASPAMIAQARRQPQPAGVHFSVEDMFCLPYADRTFSVVIAANVLHIVPQPERALRELRRVLTADGVLIAPTFAQGELRGAAALQGWLLRAVGLPVQHRWTPEGYLEFLRANGWQVRRAEVLEAGLPLVYAECTPAGFP